VARCFSDDSGLRYVLPVCGLAFGNTYGSAALEQVVINFQRIPDATLFEFVVVHNGSKFHTGELAVTTCMRCHWLMACSVRYNKSRREVCCFQKRLLLNFKHLHATLTTFLK